MQQSQFEGQNILDKDRQDKGSQDPYMYQLQTNAK